MKTGIVSSLDEETIQGEEIIQGRKLYEEIRYIFISFGHLAPFHELVHWSDIIELQKEGLATKNSL